MTLPANTNPKFLAWYNGRSEAVKTAIDEYWDQTATDARLFPGHKSEEYARLTFLIEYARDEHGYNA